LALKALTAGAVKARFHLTLTTLAIGTLVHVKSYNIIRSDLGSP
jgi:ribosomal protein L35AE/L33A